MKKELGKLSLHKEELVSLNAPQMDSIKGGSTWGCVSSAVSSYITSKISDELWDRYVSSYVSSALDWIESQVESIWDSYFGSEDEEDEPIDGGTLPEVIASILFKGIDDSYSQTLAQKKTHLDTAKSILWEISKKGLDRKSYLLGTYHGGISNKIGYAYIDSLSCYREILESVDVVGLECNLDDTTIVKMQADRINNCVFQRYPSYAFLPDSIMDFSQLFSDTAQYNFIRTYMLELKGRKLPVADSYHKLKPVFTIQMTNTFFQIMKEVANHRKGTNFTMMDAGIFNQAKLQGKQLIFMESAKYHVDLLNRLNYSPFVLLTLQEQAQALYYYCKELKDGHLPGSFYETQLQNFYHKGDLDALLKLENEYYSNLKQNPVFIGNDKEITDGRNQDWMSIITTNIDKKSCLIAVGALHLPGKNGLINLLREEGYEVKPVDIFK